MADRELEKEISLDKKEKKAKEKEEKLEAKLLLKQRTRVYNQTVAAQKRNLKRVKHAPKDAYISLRHINKIYDNKVQAVFDFNLDIKQHEFVVFVGPSGCGKSTTLRMIAGLEDITYGDLFIDKTFANELHPKDRDIAMVFQSYALYPHMSVEGNMSFGLKIKKIPTLVVDENNEPVLGINKPAIRTLERQLNNLNKFLDKVESEEEKAEIEKDISEITAKLEYLRVTPVELFKKKHMNKLDVRNRVKEAAKILQIEEYLNRKPKALSGGQCQRVALGRAIVKNAKVFLMDEPLSNLDAKLRVAMRSEIIKLHKALNATTIYVTHDQTEAMTMATRIVVMSKGYVQQIGTPIEIYNHPANTFVATFIGSPSMNMVNVKYKDGEVIFADGVRIKLTPDFDEAVKLYFPKEIERLEKKLVEIENDFVEKHELLEKIELVKKAIVEAPEAKKAAYEAKLAALSNDLVTLETSNIQRKETIAHLEALKAIDLNDEIPLIFGIRPEDIYQSNRVLTDEHTSQEFELKVTVAELLGHEYYVHSDFGGVDIVSKIHAKRIVNVDDVLKLVFDISKIHLFDSVTTKIIK